MLLPLLLLLGRKKTRLSVKTPSDWSNAGGL